MKEKKKKDPKKKKRALIITGSILGVFALFVITVVMITIIGDKAKAYEQGAMEERQENRNRTMQELGDMFDREVAETDGGRDFDLANPGGTEENVKSAPKTIQSSVAAYRDLNATLGNFYEQPKNDSG